MRHLSDAEYVLVRDYVDQALAEVDALGLELRLDSDLANWVRLLRDAPGRSQINPSFDPTRSWLTPGNAFWLGLADRRGEVVACECLRLFETDDFVALLRSHRVFYDLVPVVEHRPLELVLPPDLPRIAGRVTHGGGLWVHPDWRGRGLAALVPRLLRALALRHFEPDWHTGLIRDTPSRRAMAAESYGLEHQVPCTRGLWPPYGRALDIALVYSERGEILELIRRAAGGASRCRGGAALCA